MKRLMGIMSGRFSYGLSYRLGLAFWDTFDSDRVLADLIEGPAALPAGRALDLGCGTGRNSVYLARHSWNVTGVDFVEHAITLARARAVAEGMQIRTPAAPAGHPRLTPPNPANGPRCGPASGHPPTARPGDANTRRRRPGGRWCKPQSGSA